MKMFNWLFKTIRSIARSIRKPRNFVVELGLAALICGLIGWLLSGLVTLIISYGFLLGAVVGAGLYVRSRLRRRKTTSVGNPQGR